MKFSLFFAISALLPASSLAITPDAYTADALKDLIMSSSTPADIANTPDSVWNRAAATTLEAIAEMPWSASVPEREFRYFVAPLRINNEVLDDHRPVIYQELRERVKGLAMEQAILEVNHWCHEYVTYQPSDARTHSPLQSMSSCIGRCGEESTFTAAALRAVGIPARQVYTPRWAHTDDNHAWVEAWADGRWHFIGACEPEPRTGMAWFNAPATRAMMMHTFVRGAYDGAEEVVETMPDGVVINVTSTYAPVATTTVHVVDADSKPVPGAEVTFRVYNYAEFHTIATRQADAQGVASLTTGMGDMLVWATDGENFGMEEVASRPDANVTVTLSHCVADLNGTVTDYDITPPRQGSNVVTATPAEVEANAHRLAYEDSLRLSRVARFYTPEQSHALADRLGLDRQRVAAVMADARGNHATLADFLSATPANDRERALGMLEALTAKDRSDVPMAVLLDHMTTPADTGSFYTLYILSPRIEVEDMSAWRAPLTEALAPIAPKMRSNPELWAQWLKDSIAIVPNWRPDAVSMHPEAALACRKANTRSRSLLFVAGARAMGIPARIDPVTGQTQWADADRQWHTVAWENAQASTAKGQLRQTAAEANVVPDPAYYTHFTLSRIEGGKPRLLEFDEDATLASAFSAPVDLDPGTYMLTTGQRLADGGVLARTTYFSIAPGQTASVPVEIRHDASAIEVIGNFNSENLYEAFEPANPAERETKSLLSTTGRGYYVIAVVGQGQEPSNHVIRDISQVRDQFEATGVPMVILLSADSDAARFFSDPLLPQLPATAHFGQDSTGAIAAELRENLRLPADSMPIVAIADTFNRVVYVTSGYTIGTGARLLDILRKL